MPEIKSKNNKTGFTLLELLIVMGILSILMAIVVVVINPAEILRGSRDTRRISDLGSINTALGIFEVSSLSGNFGVASTTYISIPDTSSTCANLGLPALPSGYSYSCSTEANYRNVDGTGWIPVDFNSLDIGSPIPSLPVDPINSTTTGLYYTYSTGGSWELTANLESKKNKMSGDRDVVSTDGGDNYSLLEVGNNLSLSPLSDSGLVGYWPFDNFTSGDILNNQTAGLQDISGNDNNGTAKNTNGTGMSFVEGRIGGAVNFDGVDDYVDCGNDISLTSDNITLLAWTKIDQLPPMYFGVLTNKASASYGINLNFSPTSISSLVGNGVDHLYVSKSTTISTDLWYHIAITHNSDDSNILYINGVNVKENSKSLSYSLPVNTIIGRFYSSATTLLFDGIIDDVRIYDRTLSAAEVRAIYDSTR